ncbi:MAG: hypothetical protein LBG23_05870 [Endomicrobium sp.]|nr:hypothetical protein [Endomicrobium sp.]
MSFIYFSWLFPVSSDAFIAFSKEFIAFCNLLTSNFENKRIETDNGSEFAGYVHDYLKTE